MPQHRLPIAVTKDKLLFVAGCLLGLTATPALAHVGMHDAAGMAAGFAHPFSGMDHLLAMFAVGLWAAQMKGSAKWALPLAFPLMMVVGAVPGFMGVVLPGIETGIAASVVLLGLLIAFAVRVPITVGTALIAVFAAVHGYAHGAELPHQASALAYGTGFVAATALLHVIGLSVGLFADSKSASKAVRASGGVIAACGLFLLTGAT